MNITSMLDQYSNDEEQLLAGLYQLSSGVVAHLLQRRLLFAVTTADGLLTRHQSKDFVQLLDISPTLSVCETVPALFGLESAFADLATGKITELQIKDVTHHPSPPEFPLSDVYLRGVPGENAAQQVLVVIEQHAAERFREISLQTQLNEAKLQIDWLKSALSTDTLTKVLSRQALMDRFAVELDRAKRYGHALAVMLIDLDNFKVVNDTQGHLVGDAVLSKVAATLQQNIRSSDTIGRYGGDEFIVLLPMATKAAAQANARRFQQIIADLGLGVSLSIGVATTQESGTAVEALISTADKAMYAEKVEQTAS